MKASASLLCPRKRDRSRGAWPLENVRRCDRDNTDRRQERRRGINLFDTLYDVRGPYTVECPNSGAVESTTRSMRYTPFENDHGFDPMIDANHLSHVRNERDPISPPMQNLNSMRIDPKRSGNWHTFGITQES